MNIRTDPPYTSEERAVISEYLALLQVLASGDIEATRALAVIVCERLDRIFTGGKSGKVHMLTNEEIMACLVVLADLPKTPQTPRLTLVEKPARERDRWAIPCGKCGRNYTAAAAESECPNCGTTNVVDRTVVHTMTDRRPESPTKETTDS